MDARDYVEELFARYEHSAGMEDFKEEVRSNLSDRIQYLQKNGLSAEDAFVKATAELGDISEIAEQIGEEKRKEAFSEMYMTTRSYMKKSQIIAYVAAGGLLALGLIFVLLAWLNARQAAAGLGALIPFFIAPVCAFVFLGLTQETAGRYPMPKKRALIYTATTGLILFGLIIFAMGFFVRGMGVVPAFGSLIPFVLPGSMFLAFLLLTEKNRHKPWVKEQQALWSARAEDMANKRMEEHFTYTPASVRFGLFSGALWLLAVALFIALGLWLGFRYSWLVFLFALPAQLLIQAQLTAKK